MEYSTDKILILGDKNTGKTMFFNKIRYNNKYLSIMGCKIYNFNIETKKGIRMISLWDIEDDGKFGVYRIGYYNNAKIALIFFSIDKNETHKHIKSWIENLRKINPNIPILIIGNKLSNIYNGISANLYLELKQKYNAKIYEISLTRDYDLCEIINEFKKLI